MGEPKYFKGRRQIAEVRMLNLDQDSWLECAVYERWEDTGQGVELACGQSDTVTFSITCGVSEKTLSTITSKIGGSIGVKDVASLSSEISASLGCEVNWNVATSLSHTASCTAPKCGRTSLEVQQLVRDYELTLYTKKGFIFRAIDRHPTRTVVERTALHSLWPTVEEYDERCQGCAQPPSPGYNGRLIAEAGNAIFFLPFRLTKNGSDVRVLNKVVSFEFAEFSEGFEQLEHGAYLDFPADSFSSILSFFAGRSDMTAEGVRVYCQVDRWYSPDNVSADLRVASVTGVIRATAVE